MKKQRRKRNCFTLVELMMVLVVILILVSVGILVAPLITRQASEAKTKALMSMIENAIEEYKNSNLNGGNYPVSPDMYDSAYKTQYTPFFIDDYDIEDRDETSTGNIKNNMIQFFEIEQLKSNLSYDPKVDLQYVTDGFCMPFLYMAPGYRMNGSYDLISTGANMLPGNGEGKKKPDSRWQEGRISVEDKRETKYSEQLGEGDDLANFKAR